MSRQETGTGRLQAVDALRVAAILGVMVIHARTFESAASPVGAAWDPATVLNQLVRFGVPFFFVASGYFWAGKFASGQSPWPATLPMAKRLLFLFAAWCLIYIVAVNPMSAFSQGPLGPLLRIRDSLAQALAHPLDTLFVGTAIHLWFLMSLLWCVLLGAWLVGRGWTVLLVVLAAALYVIGLLGKAYAQSPLGFHINFSFRHGPFFGLLFFATGYLLQRAGPKQRWLCPGLALALAGCALHFTEVAAIHRWWGTTMMQDYVAGTYLWGLGVSMVALAWPGRGTWPLVSTLGPLTLGAYASHLLFVYLLWGMRRAWPGPTGDLLHLAAVFVLSYAASYVLARWRWTRPLVS